MDDRPTTNDLTVLALVAERSAHGWALAAKLARGGEIGQIWSISRPIVYHALDRLERAGLVRAAGLERGGRGPHRVIYAATPEGWAVNGSCRAMRLRILRSFTRCTCSKPRMTRVRLWLALLSRRM